MRIASRLFPPEERNCSSSDARRSPSTTEALPPSGEPDEHMQHRFSVIGDALELLSGIVIEFAGVTDADRIHQLVLEISRDSLVTGGAEYE